MGHFSFKKKKDVTQRWRGGAKSHRVFSGGGREWSLPRLCDGFGPLTPFLLKLEHKHLCYPAPALPRHALNRFLTNHPSGVVFNQLHPELHPYLS